MFWSDARPLLCSFHCQAWQAVALRLCQLEAWRDCPGSADRPHVLFQIRLTDPLGKLSHILEMDHFALVVHEQIQCEWACCGPGWAGSSAGQ